MTDRLRILHLEDDALDAELVAAALTEAGLVRELTRVESEEGFRQALAARPFDAILSDFSVPGFSGTAALVIARELRPDVPFIFVSGTLGEESAVDMLRLGATDYVVKQRLTRLPAAVLRAQAEAHERAVRREAERALATSQRFVQRVVEASPDLVYVYDLVEHRLLFVSPAAQSLLGHTPSYLLSLRGEEVTHLFHPDEHLHIKKARGQLRRSADGEVVESSVRMRHANGSWRWFRARESVFRRGADGQPIEALGTAQDVTPERQAKRREGVLHSVTRVLAEASDLAEAVPRILEAVCTGTGLDVAELWTVDAAGNVLRWAGGWQEAPFRESPFIQESRAHHFTKGMPLPGRVWATGEAEWLEDLAHDVTLSVAGPGNHGLRSAIAIPVRRGTAVSGVMVFFGVGRLPRDAALKDALDALGRLIGDFMQRKESEQALRESEERYRSVIAAMQEGVVVQGADGRVQTFNDSARRIMGLALDEVTDSFLPGSWRVVTEDGAPFPREERPAARALRTGRPCSAVVMGVHRADGSVAWLSVNAQPLFRSAAKDPHAVLQSFTDVSDRKRSEEVLRQRDHQLADAQRIAHLGSWEWDVGGAPVNWSEELFRIAGRTAAEGSPTFDEYIALIHPEDRERVKRLVAEAVRTGAPFVFLHRLLRADGEVRTLHCRGEPTRDPATGAVLRLSGTALDITDVNRAQEQIAEQAALLDKARDAIYVLNLAWEIRFWNKGAEGIYGFPRGVAVGQHADTLLYRGRPRVITEAQAAVVARGEWSGELPLVRQDGTPVTVESRWTLLRDAFGQPRSVLVIETDVTEKKALEARFLRTQRMESIGTLAGGIAHDLNNVLAPILMATSVLQRRTTDERSQRLLSTVESSALRGSDMVRQVLGFARGVEGDRLPLQAAHLIRDMEKIVRETFPKDIRVHVDIPSDLALVLADATQVQQVLLNLCVNARDAMPLGGTLSITAQQQTLGAPEAAAYLGTRAGPHVVISVKDTGTGIDPAIVEKVFEPFFTTKEVGKGTGLGLSTSLAIAKSHGGFIEVDSTPGVGTDFRVWLPLVTGASSSARKEAVASPAGTGQTVLVVDDEAAIREITRETLESQGYRVLTAGDGAEAVIVFTQKKKRIDIVLTDMNMPVMDGTATVAALRRLDPQVRIVAASGRDLPDALREGPLAVQGLLAKPYSAAQLLSVLAEALGTPPTPPKDAAGASPEQLLEDRNGLH